MTPRQLVIRLEEDQAELWVDMLRGCVKRRAKVAVVTGVPADGTERVFEGVLIEVEPLWLRVQPVDAEDLPCGETEYVARAEVDHVVVYADGSLSWLAAHGHLDGAEAGSW